MQLDVTVHSQTGFALPSTGQRIEPMEGARCRPNADFCKSHMRICELNVMAGEIYNGLHKPVRCQNFVGGEMRRLLDKRITATSHLLDPHGPSLDSAPPCRYQIRGFL